MSESEVDLGTTLKLKEKIEETISEIATEINGELSGEYSLILDYVLVTNNKIEINLMYARKLFEISEAVSESLYHYVIRADRELSEEEIDELYNNQYEELLAELNNEYCIYIDADINMNLYDRYPFRTGELKMRILPLRCEHDYCYVGSYITIEFNNIIIERVIELLDRDIEYFRFFVKNIVDVVLRILDL